LSNKITLYQDVDGCLNASMPPWAGSRISTKEATTSEGRTYMIRYAVDLISALKGLSTDLVWLTTWTHDGPKIIAPLVGWPAGETAPVLCPPAEYAAGGYQSIYWKFAALELDQLANPRPFIWVDDELADFKILPSLDLWERLDALGTEYIVVAPKDFLGVTPKQVAEMAEFIAKHEQV